MTYYLLWHIFYIPSFQFILYYITENSYIAQFDKISEGLSMARNIIRLLRKLSIERYMETFMKILSLLVVIATVLLACGIIYVLYTESFRGVIMPGIYRECFTEMLLLALGYLCSFVGLVMVYNECRKGKGGEDVILLGSILMLLAWLLIHYIYSLKRTGRGW